MPGRHSNFCLCAAISNLFNVFAVVLISAGTYQSNSSYLVSDSADIYHIDQSIYHSCCLNLLSADLVHRFVMVHESTIFLASARVYIIDKHVFNSLPPPVDFQVEDIESLVVSYGIVELLRLDAVCQIQLGICDALFALDTISDLSSGRIQEATLSLRERVECFGCRRVVLDDRFSHGLVHVASAHYRETFRFEAVGSSSRAVGSDVVVLLRCWPSR